MIGPRRVDKILNITVVVWPSEVQHHGPTLPDKIYPLIFWEWDNKEKNMLKVFLEKL